MLVSIPPWVVLIIVIPMILFFVLEYVVDKTAENRSRKEIHVKRVEAESNLLKAQQNLTNVKNNLADSIAKQEAELVRQKEYLATLESEGEDIEEIEEAREMIALQTNLVIELKQYYEST